jgi:hypothetical protein
VANRGKKIRESERTRGAVAGFCLFGTINDLLRLEEAFEPNTSLNRNWLAVSLFPRNLGEDKNEKYHFNFGGRDNYSLHWHAIG